MSKYKRKKATRLKSISDRMNTCSECGFTALFMYTDSANCPLCPKCHGADIKAFKSLISDIGDDLECESENSLNEVGPTELKF